MVPRKLSKRVRSASCETPSSPRSSSRLVKSAPGGHAPSPYATTTTGSSAAGTVAPPLVRSAFSASTVSRTRSLPCTTPAGGDRLRSHLIAVRVDSPELRAPAASEPPELTGDNLPSECPERVPPEGRDRPPTVRLDLRKQEDQELVEPAAERVPTGWSVGEPEREDPDPDEEQPPERATLEGETDYEDLPRSTTAVRGQRTSSSWNEPATRVPLAFRDPAVTA